MLKLRFKIKKALCRQTTEDGRTLSDTIFKGINFAPCITFARWHLNKIVAVAQYFNNIVVIGPIPPGTVIALTFSFTFSYLRHQLTYIY